MPAKKVDEGSFMLVENKLQKITFTKRSLLLREYSCKNSNLTVDQKEVYDGYRSVIASMTEEGGILQCETHM